MAEIKLTTRMVMILSEIAAAPSPGWVLSTLDQQRTVEALFRRGMVGWTADKVQRHVTRYYATEAGVAWLKNYREKLHGLA